METSDTSPALEQFNNNLLNLHKSCKKLSRILPHWISFRKNARVWSSSKSRSTNAIAESTAEATWTGLISSAFSCIGSAVTITLQGINPAAISLASRIANVATFGMFRHGYLNGMSHQYQCTMEMVTQDLRSDSPETRYVEESVKKVMGCLSALEVDLEANKDDGQILQEIDSLLAKSPNGSIIGGHKLFLEWSQSVYQLLQGFLTVVIQSTVPCSQIVNERGQNTDDLRRFKEWSETLKEGLISVEPVKLDAYKKLKTVKNLLGVVPSGAGESQRSGSLIQQCQDDALGEPSCKMMRYDASCDRFSAIDDWFEQVRNVYENSMEMADHILYVLSVSGLSWKCRIPPKKLKDHESSNIEEEKSTCETITSKVP